MKTLSEYIYRFSKLRVDRSKGKPAPHKPILLLSIIHLIEKQQIKNNKIGITPELVATFKDYWHKLVADVRFTSNFSLPFYHLKSDGFWHIQTYPGQELILTNSNSIKSFLQLKQVVAYGYFNTELFEFLLNEHTRKILKQSLVDAYFSNISFEQSNNVISEIINQILHEPPSIYKAKALTFDEEEVFVRSGVFKKEIPKIYNFACAISGMKIISDSDVQMVDACHIVPFSESHDDTISNGLSLCPNLHRAFDRGLISISHEYKVLVKPFFEQESFYSVRQFEGRQIALPTNGTFFPSQQNLAAHRIRHQFT